MVRISSALAGLAALLLAPPALTQDGGPYLATPPDMRPPLAAPPEPGSAEGEADLAAFAASRALEGTARWDMAMRDAAADPASMMDAFACALGAEISPEDSPVVQRLLSRATADIGAVVGVEKDRHGRARPFRAAEGQVCIQMSPDAGYDDSYPSGHSTLGWIQALVLASIAPDRAAPLVARGRAFGESRIVCGLHYPTDVQAGQLIATTVFAALQADPDFQADRAAAEAELEALRADARAPDAARCTAEAGLVSGRNW